MKRLCFLLVLSAALFVLAACQPPRLPSPSGTPKEPPTTHIALALPQSGPYAAITNKIVQGSRLAAQELQKQGTSHVQLHVINTAAPQWLNQIKTLPASCAVVGGPLYGSAYAAARQAGVLEKKVFFSFMPALEPGDEGTRAWRYFPSRRDQIDALVNFALSKGIRTFGSFSPSGDTYSQRMVELFEKKLAEKGLPLEKYQYRAGAQLTWPDTAAQFINPTQQENNPTPLPNTKFEALFVPGAWKDMSHITTSLTFNGEERLVLLGTTSWEQSLAGKRLTDADRYQLAIFPGAWQPSLAPTALQGAHNDFWVALGYSFTRFAYSLDLSQRLPATAINDRIRARNYTVPGLGKISWDSAGVAHQELFLFQPSATGIQKLDSTTFQKALSAAKERTKLRRKGLPVVDEQGNPLVPGLAPATPAPGVIQGRTPAQGNQIGTRPLPSYKLRLPSNVQ